MPIKKMLPSLFTILFVVTAIAQESIDPDLLFKMSFDELLNMPVITASKSEEKLTDAAGVMTVVTRDEIERFGGITLRDILSRVPGLVATSAYFTDRSIITARGAQIKINSGHILLLINGRPVREIVENSVSSEIYETFPVDIIDRIEVIRGPGSVLYGTNAFSGVINIITIKAEGNNAKVTASAGAEGAFGTSAALTFKKGDFDLVAGARYNEQTKFKRTFKYYDQDAERNIQRNLSIPNKGPGTFLSMHWGDFRFMTTWNEWQTTYILPDTAGENTWTKTFNDLQYKYKFNDNWNMAFNFTYTHASLAASTPPSIERNSNDMVAEWANFIKTSDKLRLVIGGLLNYTKGREEIKGPRPFTVSDDSRNNFSFYTQMDYQVLSTAKLIGGFQANKVKNHDIDVVPRVAAVWHLVPRLNMKIQYGQAFRAPSINEIGLDILHLVGNPDLNFEKVGSTDIGLNYMGEQVQLGFNYFHNDRSDIIIPDRSVEPGIYINAGKIKFQGVEFESKFYITKEIYITGSMLYQQNKDTETNTKNVTPLANLGIKGGISYMSDNGLTLGLYNIYQGQPDDKFTSTLNPKAEAYNLASLYCQQNMSKLFHWNSPYHISLYLQVDNLLDQELWVPFWGGGILGETIPWNPGRTIFAGLKAEL